MRVFVTAVSLFCAGVALHWIVWHVRLPKRQTRSLLLILLGSLAAAMPVLLCSRWLGSAWPWRICNCAAVAQFHVAASFAYAAFYSALEGASPSMCILTCVDRAAETGCTRQELIDSVHRLGSIESRLDAMVRDEMIVQNGAVTRLTNKGSTWARAFCAWRRVLSLPKGG